MHAPKPTTAHNQPNGAPALPSRRALLGYAAAAAASALGLGLAGMPGAARASQPLRFILPLSAGSGVDAIARAATPALGQALDRAVMVDNQPGAGGVIGTQAIVRAAPRWGHAGLCLQQPRHFPLRGQKPGL